MIPDQGAVWITSLIVNFLNWDSLNVSMNRNYKALSWRESKEKDEKHIEKLFRKSLKKKVSVNSRLKAI